MQGFHDKFQGFAISTNPAIESWANEEKRYLRKTDIQQEPEKAPLHYTLNNGLHLMLD